MLRSLLDRAPRGLRTMCTRKSWTAHQCRNCTCARRRSHQQNWLFFRPSFISGSRSSRFEQVVTSGVGNRCGAVRRTRFLEHTRYMHRDGVGADEQRFRDLLVGFAAGEELQDLELTRGETSRIALESQSIPFAKRGNPPAKRREADRGGNLLALIEQGRRLRLVVASAGV